MNAAIMAEAQEQALGMFADAVLKLALHIQQEAMVAEDLDQKVRAAGAMHRLGRGLRQTLALQAKLARDARGDAAAAAEGRAPAPQPAEPSAPRPPPDPEVVAIRRRRDWLTRGVERCVWNEHDRAEEAGELIGDSLLEDLGERLADLMADPQAFLALDPDALLVELCTDLGLTPPKFHPPAPAIPSGQPAAPGTGANGHDPAPDSS